MLAKPMRLRPSLTATASLHRAPVRRGCLLLLAGILLAGAAHGEPAESLDDELGQTGDEPLDLSTPLPEIKHAPKLKAAMPGLITPWNAKVGVNYRKAPVPNAEFLPSPLPDSTLPDQSTGVGWANLTTSRVPLGWDKATIETQVDPLDEQSKLGTTLSRSMPLGDELSLTLQNGLAVSRTFANSSVSSSGDRLSAHLVERAGAAFQSAANGHDAVARRAALQQRRQMAAHLECRAETVWRAHQSHRLGERNARRRNVEESQGRLQAELVTH